MSMKTAYCLMHVPFEGPGVFRASLERQGYQVFQQLVPEKGLPAELGDFLLIMGGPMSVNDSDPWLSEELVYIQAALSKNIPIVGVCLGSQLLTQALGNAVTPHDHFEIGMVPITLSEEGLQDPVFKTMPRVFDVFQWHGEGFALPPKTIRLAGSEHYPVQAYRYGANVYALLFHLELDTNGIRTLCQECSDDVMRGGLSPDTMMSQAHSAFPQLHACADRLITHLTSESI